jgi:hypothetical protein
MSGKLIAGAAVAILLGSTAIASAQTVVDPYPYGYLGGGYTYYAPYVPGAAITFGAVPYGYYGYAPRYYDYAPGYYGRAYNGWNDNWWDWNAR